MAQISYGTITITDTTDLENFFLIYKGSSSNTTAPSIIWSGDTNDWKTDITQVTGDYIWAITVFKYTGISITSSNYTDYYSDPVCLTGESGTSISITSIKYSTATTSSKPADSTFTLTNPPDVPEGEWLWSRTLFSSGQSVYSKAKQGQKGEQGEQGEQGERGISILKITTAPTTYTTTTGGFTPSYRVSLSTVKTQSGQSKVLVGDIIEYDSNHYRVGYIDSSYVYLGASTSIKGASGQSYYTYIRYADDANGTNMSSSPTGKTYIGVYAGTSSTAPSSASSYAPWMKYIGTDGQPGSSGVSVTQVRELYYLTTGNAPSKPTAQTTIYDYDVIAAWTSVVPEYINNGKYYISLETTLSNSTKVWSNVVLDQALTDANYNAAIANSISQSANENANGALSQASEANYKTDALDTKLKYFFYPGDSNYPGVYAVSGINNTPFNESNIATYGFNVALKPANVAIGYNTYKALELDGSIPALKLYKPSKISQGAQTAQLDSNGLVLSEGGIRSGDVNAGNSGFIYLSTKDYGSNLTINGHQASNWREVIGTKFGVDADGNLYASNADISGKITVGSGSNVYTTDDINPLEIGGRNLVLNSKDLKTWRVGTNASFTTDGEYRYVTLNGTTTNWSSQVDIYPTRDLGLLDGSSLLLSFEYKASANWQTNNIICAGTPSAVGAVGTSAFLVRTKYISLISDSSTVLPATNEWKKATLLCRSLTPDMLTSGSGALNSWYIQIYNYHDNLDVSVRKIKLERGNIATDWTPAPEDTKSIHTLTSSNTRGATYATILGYAAEGTSTNFTVTSTAGVNVGDTVRIAYKVSNMGTADDRPVVYCIGTVTNIWSETSLQMTSHGLDTTIIDGGNIITNSIGANQIAANAITSDKLAANAVTAGKIAANAIDTSKLTVGTQNDVLNSNVLVGGRNLFGYGSQCESLGGFSCVGTWDIRTEDGFTCAHAAGALTTTKYLHSKISFTPKPLEIMTFSLNVKIKNIVYGTTNPMCELYFSGQTIDGTWREWSVLAVYVDGVKYEGSITNIRFPTYISDTKWHHFAVVARAVNANFTDNLAPFIYLRDATGDLYVRNIKYERGNKATDWSPAPEDVQAEIDAKKSVHTMQALNVSGSQYTETYANLLSYSTEGRTGLGCRVASIEGIKIGDTIRLAYVATDMNNATVYIVGTVTGTSTGSYPSVFWTSHGLDTTVIDGGHILTGSIDANRIKANVISAVNNGSGKIDADKINVGAITVGSLKDGSSYSTTTQMNQAIDTAVDDISVGGRNLLLNTAISERNKELCHFTTGGMTTIALTDGIFCYKLTGSNTVHAFNNTDSWSCLSAPLKANTTYTYSFWAKYSKAASFNFTSFGHFQVNNSASSAGDKTHEDVAANRVYSPSSVKANTWTKMTLTFTTNSLAGSSFGVYPLYDNGGDTVAYLYGFKLEEGNKATDWTPAPEDSFGENLLVGTDSTTVHTTSIASSSTSSFIDTQTFTVPRIAGETIYIASFEAKANSAITISCFWYNPNTTTASRSSTGGQSGGADGYCTVQLSTVWRRYWVCWMQSDNVATSKKLIIGRVQKPSSGTSTVDIRAIKFEVGAIATPWSAAPRELAATATSYITNIDTNNGITIKAINGTTDTNTTTGNYIKLNASGLYFYKGGAEQAYFTGSAAAIGKSGGDRIIINSSGLHVYNYINNTQTEVALFGSTARIGKASVQRVEVASAAINMYSPDNQKRVAIDSNTGVVIGRSNKGHTTIDDNGLSIFDVNNKKRFQINSSGLNVFDTDGSTNVATFGASARVGKTTDTNITITAASTDSGVKMNVKNSAGTSYVRIADIGFDNTQGYETDHNFPKGSWYTLGYRAGTAAQRGYYSLVAGFNNIASHNASVAFGINNNVYAPCGFAVGINNTVGDSSKTSQNSYTTSKIGNCCAVIGYGLQTGNAENQLICGCYNQVDTSAGFIVGGGSASTRYNLFNVGPDRIYHGTHTVPSTTSTSTSTGFYLGLKANRWLQLYSWSAVNTGSDGKRKDVLGDIDFAKELIMGLEPVEFQWKDSDHIRSHMGFIAQDAAKVGKALGKNLSFYEASYIDESKGDYHGEEVSDEELSWGMMYDELIAPLVKVVQMQQKEIDQLKQEVQNLKNK